MFVAACECLDQISKALANLYAKQDNKMTDDTPYVPSGRSPVKVLYTINTNEYGLET